jgi:hypothetical protein
MEAAGIHRGRAGDVAVTPDGSRLGVFYYSREGDAANNQYRYRGRLATISGGTVNFTPSENISDVASLPEFGRDSVVNSVYMGDYDMATADNNAFHVVWSDNRSDHPVGGAPRKDPNVYYDKINFTVGPNGIWTGLGDGVSWTNAANWSNNVIPGPADDVIISIAANPNIVLSSGAQSIRSMTCAENLSITGGSLSIAQPSTTSASLTLGGGTLAGAGSLSLTGGSSFWTSGGMSGSGAFIVNAAATFNLSGAGAKISTKPLQINGVATVNSGGNQVVVLNSLAMGGAARFDLNDNDLILDYTGGTQLGAIQALINTARSGGTWTGNGLTSTAAKNNPQDNTTLGAMEATDYPGVTFDGQPLDGSMVLVKYTYYGDTDFNGKVNFDDYVKADNGFNNHLSGWANGDADGDGAVDFDDYVLIDLAFNTQGAVLRNGSGLGPGAGGGQRLSGGARV